GPAQKSERADVRTCRWLRGGSYFHRIEPPLLAITFAVSSMQTPHVTVLTAVRNGSRYLPETIASIRAQTFRDWEYIIVDDASEDDTCRVVEAASRDDSRIRLIRRSKSEGPFAAGNGGLSQARGRFVVRTDADDISPPHRIDRQLRFLNAERRFRACISPWQSFDERGLIAGSVNRIPSGAD